MGGEIGWRRFHDDAVFLQAGGLLHWGGRAVAAAGSVFRPLPSLPRPPSLEQIAELQMSGGVAGVPLPVRGPMWAAVQSTSLAVLPPAVDGNPRRRQECVRAWSWPRRPRCIDRSVQLGLIPAVLVSLRRLLPCAVQ